MFAIPSPVGEKTYRTRHCIYHHISYMSYLKPQFGWSHHMCCLNPQLEPILVGGLEHYIFFHILGIIIPTDFIFFWGIETTNQNIIRSRNIQDCLGHNLNMQVVLQPTDLTCTSTRRSIAPGQEMLWLLETFWRVEQHEKNGGIK